MIVGILDPMWVNLLYQAQARYEHSPDGEALTELSGEVPDDAALLGILNMVHDLGLSIRLVEVKTA